MKSFVPLHLASRQIGCSVNHNYNHKFFELLCESRSIAAEYEEIPCSIPNHVRSTFLMAFSCDHKHVASSHGDHRIYVTLVDTGKLVRALEGHARTPWCVTWHPTNPNVLASGCLAGEVRVWDLNSRGGACQVWISPHASVIASLTFHPLERILVIATHNHLLFWDWSRDEPFASCSTHSEKEKVRYVKFDASGSKLLTGIANLPSPSNSSHYLDYSDRYQVIARRNSLLARVMSVAYRSFESDEVGPSHEAAAGPPLSPNARDRLVEASDYASRNSRRTEEDSLWGTFRRLQALCDRLSFMMSSHRSPDQMSPLGPMATVPSTSRYSQSAPNLGSPSIMALLTRLHESLENMSGALNTTVAREHVQQVRERVTEILSRLVHVSGYHARLTSLREQIYDTVERMSGSGQESRVDLLSCLALVDMSIQLTRHMQNLLASDVSRQQVASPPTSTREAPSDPQPSTSSGLTPTSSRTSSFSIPEVRVIPPVGNEGPSALGAVNPGIRPRSPPLPDILQHQEAVRGMLSQPVWTMSGGSYTTYRVQCWDFTRGDMPNLRDASANVLVSKCRIHNDASLDLSSDGLALACLVPLDPTSYTSSINLNIYSLAKESIGRSLATWTFGSNAISVSFSPTARYVVVGLSSQRLPSDQQSVIAQIFKLESSTTTDPDQSVATTYDSLEHVRNVSSGSRSASEEVTSLNAIRWLPRSGAGLIWGTNRGALVIARPQRVAETVASPPAFPFWPPTPPRRQRRIPRRSDTTESSERSSTATQTSPHCHTASTQTQT